MRLPRKLVLSVLLACFFSFSSAFPQKYRDLIEQTKQKVHSGEVNPEKDLKPLIDALKSEKSEEEKSRLVDAIEDLGRGDGDSPAAVKRYLLEQATPIFLELGKTAKDVFLRGGVFLSLRNMGASRTVLEEAASIAEADPESYVQSRGEILRNFISTMPEESEVSAINPVDPAGEREALAYLKSRKLGASADQLRISALEGDTEAVQALLNAGVNVNSAQGLSSSPLSAAVFSGCGAAGGETEKLTQTVQILLAAGADVHRKDDNGNTVLLSAAQMCGPRIIEALVEAGADPNLKNGSGINPLAMALIMQKLDSAEFLVEKGARLDAQLVQMVSGMATTPRAQEIVRKASQP